MAKKTTAAVEKSMGLSDYKPTLNLDEKIYPGVKDVKIDDVIDITLKVKITNISRDRWNGDKLNVTGTIENAAKDKWHADRDEDSDD